MNWQKLQNYSLFLFSLLAIIIILFSLSNFISFQLSDPIVWVVAILLGIALTLIVRKTFGLKTVITKPQESRKILIRSLLIGVLLLLVFILSLFFPQYLFYGSQNSISCEEAINLLRSRQITPDITYTHAGGYSIQLKDGTHKWLYGDEAEKCGFSSELDTYYDELNENCSKPDGKWGGKDCPSSYPITIGIE